MQMNPSIILAGQPLNALGAIQQGNQAAAQTNALRDQNNLRNLYASQGAGILAGDQGALNALAGLDPAAAMGIQQGQLGMAATRQNMQFDAEKMQMAREQAKLAAAQHAASMTAAERAQAAKELADGLSGAAYFYQKGDRAGYDTFLAQNGIDPSAHPFDAFPAHAAQYEGVLDALKSFGDMSAGPDPTKGAPTGFMWADPNNRAAGVVPLPGAEKQQGPLSSVAKLTADFKAGLIDKATYEAALQKATAQDQTTMSVSPDGTVQFSQGAVSNTAKVPTMTVDAAKNTGFYVRTLEANKILNKLEAQGTDFWRSNLDAVPFGLGNYARSPKFQKFDQARRDFVNAILRRESGAVISDQEFENANKQYFPVPGDSKEVIAQKRRNRKTAIEGLRLGSGEGAAYVDQQRGATTSAPATGSQPQGQPISDDALIQKYLGTGQ